MGVIQIIANVPVSPCQLGTLLQVCFNYSRLHLLCCALALAILPSRSQDAEKEPCSSFALRSENFYRVTKLRQFTNAFPQWVKFQNDNIYYNLNGNTFRVGDTHQDDMVVSTKIEVPKTNSVTDENENRIYQNQSGVYAYLSKNDKEFEVSIDDETSNNDHRFIMDPVSQIVFILSKMRSGSGSLFWFSSRRPGDLNKNIPTKKIAFFGQSIISMHFNDKTRDILLGAKVRRTGIVYLLKYSPNDPCGPSLVVEEQVLQYLNESYTAYQNAVLKKGGSDQRFTCPTTAPVRGRPAKDNANERACNKLKNYTNNQHAHLTVSIKMLIDANKELKMKLDEQKVTILDAVGKLNRLSQTAILNKGVPEPVFKEQLSPTEVDEYLAHKYICVSNDEFEKGKMALDISPQLNILKDSILTVKEDLAGEPKLEDLYGNIFSQSKGPQTSLDDLIGDIFSVPKGEVQSDGVVTDPPYTLYPSIDVRSTDVNQ